MRDKLNEKSIHDFTAKLRQASCINLTKDYIRWRRQNNSRQSDINTSVRPQISPISINLDLTVACNYRCSHCVDMRILNTGAVLSYDEVVSTIDYLSENGLRSVLLIGGGEPTLHPKFGEIVAYIKKKNLQLGISTNGSHMQKIIDVAAHFEERDWVRLSLDSGSDSSFQIIHRPNLKINLYDICKKVKELRATNKKVSIGFSYIVIWKGCRFREVELSDNIDEMLPATEMAANNGFDYISFKPCLIKLECDGEDESLFYNEIPEERAKILARIKTSLEKSRMAANGEINIVETLNMKAAIEGRLEKFQKQPQTCHIQIFRHVITPIGIFNCPAFRGTEWAKLGRGNDYADMKKASEVRKRAFGILDDFDASERCKNVVCFYHLANEWIENIVNSDIDVEEIKACDDDNFFL